MDRRGPAPTPSRRTPEPLRARARPRVVDVDDPRSVAAPGRPSRRSSWSRSTIADARVRTRRARAPRSR